MKKLILFSVLVVGAMLLQAQSITVHQTCGQNGQVLVIETNGHECVDLGLPSGTLWATCNVGATTPEGYGDYFAWGETSTKSTYDWYTYFDTNDGGNTFTKYNNEGGKTVLDPEDDAAHVNWGVSWRMPTEAEWQELHNNCTWTWTTQNGIDGYKVTSNKAGYTDKFIFLPAAGSFYDFGLSGVGSSGRYWLSTLYESSSLSARILMFDSDSHSLSYGSYRANGQSVRPVLQPSSISYSSSTNDTIRIYSNGCDDYQTFIGSHGSQLTMSAQSDQWSHFVRWNDGNTDNPRTITTNGNADYTAEFAKYIFSITKNAEHGTISGNNYAENLDFVTLTVTPDYGYHFTQWSDGLKDNPRIAQITQDTTFTAEFAYDRVGTCGKDLALVWSYDPTNKVLTIGNAGEFTENMQFGAEAPNEMEELVIGNSVTAIGANAFAGIETLKKVSIGESVKTIGEQAFFNCVNLETIFNYRPTPTNTYSNAFDGVDKFECELYVLPSSIDMYKAAAVWRDFYYTYAIGAEEATVTTNDVQVEPQDNAATFTWPTSNNVASYTIEITKDGVLFCTLIFNSNGQLTGIAFAPSRDGQAHAPAAVMTANGLQFTVTGLNSGTQYGYSVTAKDANDQTVATYSGEFTTTSEGTATGIDEISSSLQGGERGRLILHNGQIFILRGEKIYTVTGQEVK